MTDNFRSFQQARVLAVGSVLAIASAPELSPRCDGEAEFEQLVSDFYKLFREEMAADISYLAQLGEDRSVREFDRAIYQLRTAGQHSDNANAARFRERFVAAHKTWNGCGAALAQMLAAALEALAATAAQAARDDRRRAEWRSVANLDIGATLDSVARDLRKRLSPGQRAYMTRQVESRLRRDSALSDPAAIQDYCAQQLTSGRSKLPVPYHQVLDSLGLLEDQRAEAAVMLAYSVAAVEPSLSGAQFLTRVEDAWRAASAI